MANLYSLWEIFRKIIKKDIFTMGAKILVKSEQQRQCASIRIEYYTASTFLTKGFHFLLHKVGQ